jgi:SanA protein
MKRPSVRVAAWSAVAFLAIGIVVSLLAAMANQVMSSWGKAYATDDPARLPQVEVALVLGTLPHDPPGQLNPWLSRRLGAAVELWRSGKVRYLIVSGNRESDAYDEPTVMRDVLVARGVPAHVIYRDFAGFRTVTSIARARDIYRQKRLIIVTQRDHLDRAIFLARHMGVEAWGYDALGSAPFMLMRSLRSKLVVIYAYWDLVIGPRPAAGPRVAIGVDRPE